MISSMNLFSTTPPENATVASPDVNASDTCFAPKGINLWRTTLDFQWFPMLSSSAMEDGMGREGNNNNKMKGGKRKQVRMRQRSNSSGALARLLGASQSFPSMGIHFKHDDPQQMCTVQSIPNLEDYSSQELQESFFSTEELRQIYEHARTIVEQLVKASSSEALLINIPKDHGLDRFHGERKETCQRARKSSIHAVMDLQEEQWNTGKEDPGQIAGAYQKITQDSQVLARDEAKEETEHAQKYLFDLIQQCQGGGVYSSWATSTTPPSRSPTKSILKHKSSNLPRSVYLLGHEPFPPTTVKQRLLHFMNGGIGTPAATIEEPSIVQPPPPTSSRPRPTSSRPRPTRIQAPSRTRSMPLPLTKNNSNHVWTNHQLSLNRDTSRTLTQLVGVIRGRRHQTTRNPADSPTDESSMEMSSSEEDMEIDDGDHDDGGIDSDTDSNIDDNEKNDAVQPSSCQGTEQNAPRRQAPKRSRSTPLVGINTGSPPMFSSSPPVQNIPRKHPLTPSMPPCVGPTMGSQQSTPKATMPKKHPPGKLPKTKIMPLPKQDLTKKTHSNGSLPHPQQGMDTPTYLPLPKRSSPHASTDRSTSFSQPTIKIPPQRSSSPSVPLRKEGRNTESKTGTSKSQPIKPTLSLGKSTAASVSASKPTTVAPSKHPPKRVPSFRDTTAKLGSTTSAPQMLDARGKHLPKHSPSHVAVPPKKSSLPSRAASVPSKQAPQQCPPPRVAVRPTPVKTHPPSKHPPKRSPVVGTPLAKGSASSRSKEDVHSPLPKRGR